MGKYPIQSVWRCVIRSVKTSNVQVKFTWVNRYYDSQVASIKDNLAN
ncbi:MAG: hypothetical protein QXU32_04765 [Nitrososphaerales archaeon]